VRPIEIGIDAQTGFCAGSSDELDHFFVTDQGLSRPVLADLRDQAMFNGIPFGSPAGIVGHGHLLSSLLSIGPFRASELAGPTGNFLSGTERAGERFLANGGTVK
jgi:hypothetical protein